MTSRLLLSFPKWVAALAVSFGVFISMAPRADAQCFTPDGLDSVGCCSAATPNLPTFPNFSLQAAGVCWNACTPLPKTCLQIDVSAPLPGTGCTQFKSDLGAIDCATGAVVMKGEVTLDYTRTWTETTVAGGPPLQVWRFAAKADIEATSAFSTICPVPTCTAVAGNTAFYYGYVDFAFDCTAGTWSQVVVLYHNCDRYVHNSTLSAVPGAFHPGRTYAIIAPDTAANPFTPSIFLPAPGSFTTEGVRTVTGGACLAEEPMIQGGFFPQLTGCACPLVPQPPMNSANRLDGSAACGSAFSSLNLFPTAPWVHLMTSSLGNWTTSASYPGPEHASVAEGLLYYRDGCAPSATAQTFDVFYGGMTNLGFPIDPTLPLAPPSQRFLDLASNYSVPIAGPIALPAVGKVAPTDHLIYVNL